jgi:hypothetical protein
MTAVDFLMITVLVLVLLSCRGRWGMIRAPATLDAFSLGFLLWFFLFFSFFRGWLMNLSFPLQLDYLKNKAKTRNEKRKNKRGKEKKNTESDWLAMEEKGDDGKGEKAK